MAGCGFTSARTRIRWSFTCLVCVSVTTTRACPSRTRHHCNRRPHCSHRRSDCEDGFTKLLCYSFGSQHSGTCTRQHSCVFVLFGWIPKHVREHVMAIHAGRKMLQTQRGLICFATNVHLQFSLYWQALVRTRHHWKRPRRVVGKTGSDIHAAIPWMSVRFQGSVVARGEVSVSMSSFSCSSHKQLDSIHIIGDRVHARDSAVASQRC